MLTGTSQSPVWPDVEIEFGEQFNGSFDFIESLLSQMKIARSRSDGSMSQEPLHNVDGSSTLQHVSGKAMSERMSAAVLGNARSFFYRVVDLADESAMNVFF